MVAGILDFQLVGLRQIEPRRIGADAKEAAVARAAKSGPAKPSTGPNARVTIAIGALGRRQAAPGSDHLPTNGSPSVKAAAMTGSMAKSFWIR